jgi:nucleoside-diphosphate-sugar epimerase
MDLSDKRILVLGGAGFLGSNIVLLLLSKGIKVTVIDGLMPKTGGNISNLPSHNNLQVINNQVNNFNDLKGIIKEHDIIIDSMAWTSHIYALKNPFYDLKLNVESHLVVIENIAGNNKVIYIGSSGQYGAVEKNEIIETTPFIPVDVQGIHKVTAENHYRIFSKIKGFSVTSLRIPNCFGENQKTDGDDIGLVGSFIKDALSGNTIEIFGENRKRSILYSNDFSKIILQIIDSGIRDGFNAYNINGTTIPIKDLAFEIVKLCKSGSCTIKSIPEHIRQMDFGGIPLNDKLFKSVYGDYQLTDLKTALNNTIKYFKSRL